MQDDDDYLEREHIDEALSRAKQGSIEDALYVLDMCAGLLYGRARFNEDLAFYLAECLSKIASGADPSKALNLVPNQRGRGRPKMPEGDRFNDAVAIQATILLAERVKGINKTEAIRRLSSSDDPYPRSEWRKIEKMDFTPMSELDDQALICLAGRRWRDLLSKIQ